MKESLNNSVIYNVYPTSFYDSNNDGIGDLKGICEKLEYIKQFADIIWINPIFKSPFIDGGYDVSDYYEIDKKFGTMEDLKNLINKALAIDLKVILDLVPGHTSNKHQWFLQSKKNKKNKYSDYYIWADKTFGDYPYQFIKGDGDRPGGYITNFYYSQPALNYGFSKVKYPWQYKWDDKRLEPLHNEMLNVMRFYLKMGVSGFRVDMASSLVKDDYDNVCVSKLWQKIFAIIRADYPSSIFISEWGQPFKAINDAGFDIDFITHCYNDGYNNLFRLEKDSNVMPTNGNSFFRKEGKGEAKTFFDYFNFNLDKVKNNGYISVPSSNHDLPRISFGRNEKEQKLVYAFLFSLPSIPLIYYGDEIGMSYNPSLSKDGGYNRTGTRTPMQWDSSKNGGFSKTCKKTYLPLNEDYKYINVADSRNRKNSLYNTILKMLEIKRNNNYLNVNAEFEVVSNDYPLYIRRKCEGTTFVAIINPSDKIYYFISESKEIEVLLAENVIIEANNLRICGESFIWYKY